MDRLFRKAESLVKDRLGDMLGFEGEQSQQQPYQQEGQSGEQDGQPKRPKSHAKIQAVDTSHRFQSFAPQTTGDVKWYVDGASYFWAVSMALEEAQESIYILDWWLSPELFLRRPPSGNENYRLDNMLQAAAERGVDINIIVYKEVTQALTLDSAHTKHALEALHPNIKVFRHPDHLPTSRARLEQAFSGLSLDSLKINATGLAAASGDALKELYGSFGDTVLYWAHHEKLCVVDRKLVFMGGLDMCFGRYDTNSHPIADAHPGNLEGILFPGQDFNNARVYDFEGVSNWDHNQLDRTKNPRMGWSDIALTIKGPIVNNLINHFTDRWNFIYDEKYLEKDPGKYKRFNGENQGQNDDEQSDQVGGANVQLCRSACDWSSGHPTEHSIANAYIHAIESAKHYVYIENQFFITATGDQQMPVQNKIGASIVSRIVRAHTNGENFRVIVLMPAVPAFAGDLKSDGALGTRAIMEYQYNSINRGGHSIIERLQQRGVDDWRRYIGFYNLRNYDRINISSTMRQAEDRSGVSYEEARRGYDNSVQRGIGSGARDGGRYESRGEREDYRGSDDEYDGRERRGHREYDEYEGRGERRERRDYNEYEGRGERRDRREYDDYEGRGDRRDCHDCDDEGRERGGYREDDQYEGRGDYGRERERDDYDGQRENRGHWGQYDRQQYSSRDSEQYDRQQYSRESERYDRQEYSRESEQYDRQQYSSRDSEQHDRPQYSSSRDPEQYERYQAAATSVADRTWDTVSPCYMDGGPDIRSVPWDGDEESELNAFVSEELYIHTKVLIADDRLVICGSANLNDRSQLGTHDSEIAVVIEGQDFIDSTMDGQQYTASRFATSLRRQIWRKHLGMLPDQPWDKPNRNWTPVTSDPQDYDWGSPADRAVEDPLAEDFWRSWGDTARTNTEVFSKVFHNVPNDKVRTWEDYDNFFSRHFIVPGVEIKEEDKAGRVDYGHVVRDEFEGGVTEVKEWLSRVRGNLVEMPLDFLIDVKDLAQKGLSLNALTNELYT